MALPLRSIDRNYVGRINSIGPSPPTGPIPSLAFPGFENVDPNSRSYRFDPGFVLHHDLEIKTLPWTEQRRRQRARIPVEPGRPIYGSVSVPMGFPRISLPIDNFPATWRNVPIEVIVLDVRLKLHLALLPTPTFTSSRVGLKNVGNCLPSNTPLLSAWGPLPLETSVAPSSKYLFRDCPTIFLLVSSLGECHPHTSRKCLVPAMIFQVPQPFIMEQIILECTMSVASFDSVRSRSRLFMNNSSKSRRWIELQSTTTSRSSALS